MSRIRSGPRSRHHGLAYLGLVCAAVALVVSASYFTYLRTPSETPPTVRIALSTPAWSGGNASFLVTHRSGGPYGFTGCSVSLRVNEFLGGPEPLAASNASVRLVIGPNAYRIAWSDQNGSGTVDVGDSFSVTGDGSRLPSLSFFEFALEWQGDLAARATWSTS